MVGYKDTGERKRRNIYAADVRKVSRYLWLYTQRTQKMQLRTLASTPLTVKSRMLPEKMGEKKIAKCEYFWRQIVGEPPPPNVQNLLPQNDF